MVLFNYSTKEITAKVVYYGPGLCGKTTNLQFIYDDLPQTINKGKMLSLATKTDRTLFFDFLPIDLGTIRGMRTRLQLYTVPGQVFYNTTRKLVLKGADGVVFVADSQKTMLDANIESFRNLEQNLAEHGMTLSEMPLVIQFNKRDLPEVLSIDELNAALNKQNAPIYEAVATTGIGVHETLKACTRLVLNSLKTRYADDKRDDKTRAAAAAAAAASKALTTAAKQPQAPVPAAATSTTGRTQPITPQQAVGGGFEGDLVPLEDDLLSAETSHSGLEADLSTLVPDVSEKAPPVVGRFVEKAAQSAKPTHTAPPAAAQTVDEEALFEVLDVEDTDEVLEDILELADDTPSALPVVEVIEEESVEVTPSFHRVEHVAEAPRASQAPPARTWQSYSEEAEPVSTVAAGKPTAEHSTHTVRSAHVVLDGPTEINVPITIDIGGQVVSLSLKLSLTVEKEAARPAVQRVGVSS